MKETKDTRVDHSQYAAPLATAPTDKASSWRPIETLADCDDEVVMWTPRERIYTTEQLACFPDLPVGQMRIASRRNWTWSTHWKPLPEPPLAEPSSVDGADPWQPMETAPKDGTTINMTDGQSVDVGGWVSAADQGAEPGEEHLIAAGWWFLNKDMQPTHWTPLPAPPSAEPPSVPAVPNPAENPRLSTREKEHDDQPSPETKGSER